ncbi:MAG TPA: DUF3575 domain-containing protein [Flavisolibacter sp.]|nr:DUF3575 domain-containing protein [Flavisolibacter sp.]
MKNYLFVIALFLTTFASAQTTPKNALKFNPLSLLVMTGNVSYERSLSNNLSVQLGGFYSGAGLEGHKYEGFGIVPEVRFYFGGQRKPLNGGYIAPFGRYQNLSITNKEISNKADITTLGGGAVAGYQKRWESGFVLNVFAGPSFNRLTFRNDNQEDDFDLKSGMNGFGLRTGLTLGSSF